MVCEGGEDRDCANTEAAAARVSLLLRLQEPHRETRVRLQIHEGSQVRLRNKYCTVDQNSILLFSAFLFWLAVIGPVQILVKTRFQN